MDRKSLGVVLLERGEGNEIRSVRRRSAAVSRTNSDPLETYDDSAERERARQESAAAASPASTGGSNRRSLNLGAVAQLSSGQIADGIAECIKLNNENKINKKNAFSLKMIDFMTYLIKNRDETMSNLTIASTSLDVSAKIYGLRVDVLHNDAMNIVGNLDNERPEAEHGEDGPNAESGSAEVNQTLVKKKKKRSTKIFTTIEALCCEPEVIKLEPPMLGDGDFQTTDMLLQVTAPRHVGLGVGIHPYSDLLLDEPKTAHNATDVSYEPVKIPPGRQIGSIFTEFDFLDWDAEYDPEHSVLQTQSQQQAANEFAFDLDTSFHADDDHFVPTTFDPNDSNIEEVPAVAAFAAPREREIIADVNEIFERISARDYSYFDDVYDIRWKAGAQWTVKTVPKALSASHVAPVRQEAVRRKKDFSVDFEAEVDSELEAKFAPMKKTKVKRTPRNFEDRWTEPAAARCDATALCQFWSRPDDADLQPKRRHEDTPEPQNAHFDDYNDLDDSRHFDEPVHDFSMDQNDVAPISEPDEFAAGGFTGTNLVEAPKLTEKIYIPFSQRAKKLNMKHLKSCIWSSVHVTNDDKENVGQEAQKSEPRTFADIYVHLAEKLSKNDAKELTFPIAFVSLLHLANEKCLKLSNTDGYDDIVVELDASA